MKLAAIDIGSNAVRLLVAEVAPREGVLPVKRLSFIRVPLRLGDDVFTTGRLSEGKIEKLVKTLEAFQSLMEVHDVTDYRACATSATRQAENSDRILETIASRTGVEVELISGERESRLIYTTFYEKYHDGESDLLYIDVGGGSTEVAHISGGEVKSSRSFPIGTVRLLEERSGASGWKALKDGVARFYSSERPLVGLGTGGNINKLFDLAGLKKNESLSYDALLSLSEDLRSMGYEERMEAYNLKPDRAEVIAPASLIYLTIMEQAGIDRIVVPKIGLADGIVTELYTERYAAGVEE